MFQLEHGLGATHVLHLTWPDHEWMNEWMASTGPMVEHSFWIVPWKVQYKHWTCMHACKQCKQHSLGQHSFNWKICILTAINMLAWILILGIEIRGLFAYCWTSSRFDRTGLAIINLIGPCSGDSDANIDFSYYFNFAFTLRPHRPMNMETLILIFLVDFRLLLLLFAHTSRDWLLLGEWI